MASILANNWARSGRANVHVITFTHLKSFHILDDKVTHKNFPVGPGPGVFQLFRLALSIRRYMSANGIDHALSFMDKYNVFARIIFVGCSVRLTVTDRNNPLRPLPRLLRGLVRITYPGSNAVIAQTEWAAGKLSELTGARNVVAIPNPVRLVARADGAMSERRKLILCVGRLVHQKGHEHLLRAFAQADIPGWRLMIVGEGPLRPPLEALAVELGISERVDFPGVRSDIDQLYDRVSILTLPSLWEGFPNVLVEAMSHGLAVISSDCDAGPAEIISDGHNGLLVPPGDEAALAAALMTLAADDDLRARLGSAARQSVQAYDEEMICDRYLSVCLSTHGRA